MSERIYNVLFLCTGNSARSILAEAILSKDGAKRFRAFSAGSHPKGQVHPLALKVLEEAGYPNEGWRSKSWDEFATDDAPKMDFVFTVCDNAAGEICPVWPGQPMTAHWGIEDPAAAEGTELERKRAFVTAFNYLRNRIAAFMALPIAKLDKLSLTRKIEEIGRSEGATSPQRAITIYHNPKCGTSRNTLALIRHFGIDPKVVEYLKETPSREELQKLIATAGLSVGDVVRKKEEPFTTLGLEGADDDALLDAMMAHPILINRPIVTSGKGAALCRPSDVVLDLLPHMPGTDAFKEEGAHFLRDERVAGDDPGLIAALKTADLPTDDLGEPNRSFFVYRSLSGAVLGYGGYELHGKDALLRSIVVLPEGRGKAIGRNLVPLLMYRAFRDGARTAWLLTTSAAGFFEKLKFKRRPREEAPPAILETPQAKSLCPASAVLMSRKLGF